MLEKRPQTGDDSENDSESGRSLPAGSFTKKNLLKLTVDGSYSISAFFDQDEQVADDLETILGKRMECGSRLRFLFAPDPENDFDDIGVIVMEYVEDLSVATGSTCGCG